MERFLLPMKKQKVEAKIPQKHNPSSWLDLATACLMNTRSQLTNINLLYQPNKSKAPA